jgi:hypothetical protein
MKPILLLVSAVIVSAFAQPVSKMGKLVGHVEIGPISPVQRQGQKEVVPPEVYKRYLVLVTQPLIKTERMRSMAIRIVAKLKLSDKGEFSTDLAPGSYQVEVTSPGRVMPVPVRKEVMISARKTTKVTLKVDTGIR